MPDDPWEWVTWDGNRRLQRREFAALSLREKILAIEGMEEVARVLADPAGGVTADSPPDAARDLLRLTLATLAYRGEKVLRNAPREFAWFRVGNDSRTPGEILAHLGDLLDWAVHLAAGEHLWRVIPPGEWDADVGRFFAALRTLDDTLASPALVGSAVPKLFQGPIADALTHVGQLAMLRRMAGAPVRAENYARAEIRRGEVGPTFSGKRSEF